MKKINIQKNDKKVQNLTRVPENAILCTLMLLDYILIYLIMKVWNI